jgi:hypothetical protein
MVFDIGDWICNYTLLAAAKVMQIISPETNPGNNQQYH